MTTGAAKPTNEELVERLRAAGDGMPDAAAIMGQLWEQNAGLVRLAVHRLTGLDTWEQGFEDMEQQAYFGFHAAAHSYDGSDGIRFSTYAFSRIQWELCRYYERGSFTIRVPAFMRQRIRACMEKKRQLEAETGRAVSYEAALIAMGLHPTAIAGTLAAIQKMETVSLDKPISDDGDGSLMDILADSSDIEASVIEPVWQKELHAVLMAALGEVPEDARAVVVRHYFGGVPYTRIADEYGLTVQAILNRARKCHNTIRAGRYGPELSEFMPSISGKERADRMIRKARAEMERLQLTDDEKGLLAL